MIITTLLCFLITVSVLSYLYWMHTRKHLLQLAAAVPGPPTVPLLGNALMFMAKPEEHLIKLIKLINKYGQYMTFWLGPELNLCVTNPADIKLLLTSNKVNQKGSLYRFMVPYIGEGILSGGTYTCSILDYIKFQAVVNGSIGTSSSSTSGSTISTATEGSTWRVQRKIANPSYNKKSVKAYAGVFNEEGDHLARTLLGIDKRTTINVYDAVVRSTTQSVCQTLLNLSKQDARSIKQLDEVIKKTKRMYTLIYYQMTRWWLRIPLMWWLSGAKRAELDFRKDVDIMASDILLKKRVALKTRINGCDVDVVEKLIAMGLTDEDIKLKIFAIFTTSQEASAKIASAVLLFLAHLPEWQNKIINEIHEVIGPKNEIVTDDHLKRLPYLDMVYKEALRYLPIAALIQRTVVEEISINNGKIKLPAGTSLVIPIHVIHRNPEYWIQPDNVKPERFLPENIRRRDPNAYIPFSLGAMDCLGRIYSTALIKTLVVKVLREVQLEADGQLENLKVYFAISTEFAGGYNLRVRPRQMV